MKRKKDKKISTVHKALNSHDWEYLPYSYIRRCKGCGRIEGRTSLIPTTPDEHWTEAKINSKLTVSNNQWKSMMLSKYPFETMYI